MRVCNRWVCLTGVFICFSLQSYNVDVNQKWPSPTPWLKNRFTDFLDQMPKEGIVVEIGVQEGGYAEPILIRTNPKQLYLVDCWEHQNPETYDDPEANVSNEEHEKRYRVAKERFRRYPQVILLRKYSKDAVTLFEDASIDWVYIDANHGYHAIKEDIALWWPKVKKGGYLAGHDYIIRESFDVVRAVNEFLNEQDLYFDFLTTGDNYESWAIQKPMD